ncbi:ImmA/IrrE family metallo-endopeptidase [Phenylobacterium sp.]|uniref:ImmA/IrrE family metallo-endopeptidase n=1 Tax=Phenylobacterium sp. TaxID=1871053 RepID=UPI003983B209
MTAWSVFGDPNVFAIAGRLIADPHTESGPQAYRWSYGEWRLIVRGRSLTRHVRPNGEMRDEVRWYLGPLLQWLAEVWSPLFHEQTPPGSVGHHEHLIVAFEQGERVLLDDESETASGLRREMQAWRRRHAVWSGAAGGVFPNVWFRRQSDLMEISYDPGPTVGTPTGLEFQFNRGAVLIDVEIVASALSGFLEWGREQAREHGRADAFPAHFEAADVARLAAESWFMGPNLASLLNAKRPNRTPPPMQFGVLNPLTPEVAMFGTLTPNLSENDAASLLAVLDEARSDQEETALLRGLTGDRPPPSRDGAWEEGYEQALETLDALELAGEGCGSVDIDAVLVALGVTVRDVCVEDHSLRGVAIAGPGLNPTIVVNLGAKWNQSRPGRRFTLAHELAHILSDRGSARTITHSSTPWAPTTVERRANAFAAMFLMPYRLVDAALSALGQVTDRHSLRRVARRLGCGKGAVLEHLMNIDRIDRTAFFRIKSEFSQP